MCQRPDFWDEFIEIGYRFSVNYYLNLIFMGFKGIGLQLKAWNIELSLFSCFTYTPSEAREEI